MITDRREFTSIIALYGMSSCNVEIAERIREICSRIDMQTHTGRMQVLVAHVAT